MADNTESNVVPFPTQWRKPLSAAVDAYQNGDLTSALGGMRLAALSGVADDRVTAFTQLLHAAIGLTSGRANMEKLRAQIELALVVLADDWQLPVGFGAAFVSDVLARMEGRAEAQDGSIPWP